MPLRRAFDRRSGFFDPDCTAPGACYGHTDDSALAFVYVNIFAEFLLSALIKISAIPRSSSNRARNRDVLIKADRPFKRRLTKLLIVYNSKANDSLGEGWVR